MPIDTPQQLQDHLRLAIQVELSTIPLYLFAMYSIEDQGSEAALLIRSIVAEEMLHAALAANVLLAVGGDPRFDALDMVPTYPGMLPHHEPPLELNLVPCSLELIRDVLMRIEQPEVHGASPEPDVYETLGQFYHALEMAIQDLSASQDLFAEPQADRQLSDSSAYTPVAFDAADSGGLMLIDSADSAREAIEVIVHQGEGLSTDRWADPAHQELTHYHKLLQIAEGASPLGAVRQLRSNPRTADFPDALQPPSDLFNASYRYLFFVLQDLFSAVPNKGAFVGHMYRVMSQVLSRLGLFLVQQPLDDATFAAPTFEIYDFGGRDPGSELAELAAKTAQLFPELTDLEAAVLELKPGDEE
ncbi:MAG: ferritin-like protein [Acidimicrobiia bacterium]